MDRGNGRRLIKKEAIRKNKTGKVSGGYIFYNISSFRLYEDAIASGQKNVPVRLQSKN